MTLAIVLAAGGPAASLPDDTVGHLVAQWRAAGAAEVRVAADLPELAALAERATGPVLVSGADLVAHTTVLKHLATSPVAGTAALVLADPPADGHAAVREERGQVVAAGPARTLSDATGSFGGALRVVPADLPALVAAARTAAGSGGTDLDGLFAAFTATGALTFAHRVRLLVAHRAVDPAGLAAARAELAGVDEDAAELRLSVKERDDFFTTYFVSSWSPYVTKACARLGLTPTGVTMISVLFAVVAAVLFGVGGRPALVAGGVLLYLGFMLDCVDGQLARYTRDFSPWGGWLDTMADRAKEYVVYAGLGFGMTHAGLGDGWVLALAAMTLQTVRHHTDAWYGVLHDEAARRPKAASPGGGIGDKLNAASNRVQADTGSVSYWLKRTVVFPIGERWALIALTAAIFDVRVSLIAVLVWGVLAFAYTGALRTLRARFMRVPVLGTVDAGLHRDDGPLLRRFGGRIPAQLPLAVLAALAALGLLGVALAGGDTARWAAPVALLVLLAAGLGARGRADGALDWLVPAALRAAEYVFAIAVGVAGDVPLPLVFGYVFVLTLLHYDLVARLEKRQPAPPLHDATLGWEGRSVLLVVALIAGFAWVGMATLTSYLFVIFVMSVVAAWVRRPTRAARTAPAR
ncbi:DUF5941 domain-containing protein [Micromonospora sagamiensis]|uniref:CDP-alcohol phosphatidyltransferase-like enzyme n=1 Tax=Micromonospora sagamiensis TaxID=47875 RepID=A0A562WP44_9ACTN|nr:DUF5941 domain-containing protein [Micromonospora sagamiensis]TWJ31587.1 CDP-alcohol phosphatidyltransferase-like enzyme [Micromonospora sagamiensis]BCL15360.1 hypothetical protein GCM10017556_30990 [Micromonospora sagamiensis]